MGPNKKMWIKYKHRFAYGCDKNWNYIEIPDGEYLKECGYSDDNKSIGEWLTDEEGISDEYSWSEKYRGIEYEVCSTIPYEEIKRRLQNHKNNVEYHTQQVKKFQEMLDNSGTITKEDTDIE